MKKRIRLDGNKPSEKALGLLEYVLSVIKGQDKAVKDLADAIDVYESELFTENKPVYVGLCCGPSGVGKTLTAELLAEYWFGDRNSFTKIACEAYSESHSISKLIGSPAGYVGHWNPRDPHDSGTAPILFQGNIDKFALNKDPELNKTKANLQSGVDAVLEINSELADSIKEISELFDENGEISVSNLPYLCKKIKESIPTIAEREKALVQINRLAALQAFSIVKRPKSIILFDEIEKASGALHNILLNVIDKAQLQLSNGMITDFSNSVILMTTNVGSRAIAEILNPKMNIGFVSKIEIKDNSKLDSEIYKATLSELKKAFPPEFLARVDRISVYRPLSREILKSIVDVELRKFQEKILKNFPVSLCFDEKVKEFILNESTDKPENGARLVKNKVYKYLRKPVCRMKNNGFIQAKDIIHVLLEIKNKKPCIVFEKEVDEVDPEKK
ncbi:MAG: AAA family ATPase [Minisyncoccota bacterium]